MKTYNTYVKMWRKVEKPKQKDKKVKNFTGVSVLNILVEESSNRSRSIVPFQ